MKRNKREYTKDQNHLDLRGGGAAGDYFWKTAGIWRHEDVIASHKGSIEAQPLPRQPRQPHRISTTSLPSGGTAHQPLCAQACNSTMESYLPYGMYVCTPRTHPLLVQVCIPQSRCLSRPTISRTTSSTQLDFFQSWPYYATSFRVMPAACELESTCTVEGQGFSRRERDGRDWVSRQRPCLPVP
ncbi:hypothetical protein L209DRAFT_69296 [Thermothelomyces heterothallicus CBS 203.75]